MRTDVVVQKYAYNNIRLHELKFVEWALDPGIFLLTSFIDLTETRNKLDCYESVKAANHEILVIYDQQSKETQ